MSAEDDHRIQINYKRYTVQHFRQRESEIRFEDQPHAEALSFDEDSLEATNDTPDTPHLSADALHPGVPVRASKHDRGEKHPCKRH